MSSASSYEDKQETARWEMGKRPRVTTLAAPDSAFTQPTVTRGKPNEPDHPGTPRCDWCTRPIDDQHPGIWPDPRYVLNLDLGNEHSPVRAHAELTFYQAVAAADTTTDIPVRLHARCVAAIGETITSWFRTVERDKIK